MVNKKELMKKVGEDYAPMIEKVSIPNFTKCIAQFSGLEMKEIKDSVIEDYLTTWAINKLQYFKMLGNQLVNDIDFEFDVTEEEITASYEDLYSKYPGYYHWLRDFSHQKDNKISSSRNLPYQLEDNINRVFSGRVSLTGTTITKFFKSALEAPDSLVTEIGRIYENSKMQGTYTLSIDPVDMMLASENPYNWRSCYRLELECDSHADGCLAAVLDTSSLVGYVWNNKGDFSLYGKQTLKDIRYKRMRQWISIAPNLNAIHFNALYPSKNNAPTELLRRIREVVENLVSTYGNEPNNWKKNNSYSLDCERAYDYGYGEYNYNYIYAMTQTQKELKSWEVFNVAIPCPCGCGHALTPNDSDDVEYSGDGFVCYNFSESHEYYCECCDEYVDEDHECPCEQMDYYYEERVINETGTTLSIEYTAYRFEVRIELSMVTANGETDYFCEVNEKNRISSDYLEDKDLRDETLEYLCDVNPELGNLLETSTIIKR